MKIFAQTLLFTFLCLGSLFPVYTRYINDFKFDNIDTFEFSNISFIENGGIELAKDYQTVFKSGNMLWTAEKWNNGLLVSEGENAVLHLVTGNSSKKVFESPDHVLFSDITSFDGDLYVSAIPKATVFILSGDFKIKDQIRLSNDYVWQVIPYQKGYFILAGSPAMLYYFDGKGKEQYHYRLDNEDNLMKGMVIGETLYFIGDGYIFYKLPLKNPAAAKILAVQSFDNTITDFDYFHGKIYITTSSKEVRNLPAAGNSTDSEKSAPASQTTHAAGNKSILYEYDLSGNFQPVFEKNNIRFLSLFSMNDSLFIGSDKNAGYYEIALPSLVKRFSTFGAGKFARFIRSGNSTYAILLDPSRVVQMNESYAPFGFIQSAVFDSGNISTWGAPIINSSLQPKTGIHLLTRSGAVYSDPLWENWAIAGDKINSSPNRYLQYRVELNSDGDKTPLYRSIILPYVQKNNQPSIEKITFNYNNNSIRVSWEANDEDKDLLCYDIYLALLEKDWVKLNDKPIEENNFDILKDNFPEGKYRLKVVVSDERSNPNNSAKTNYRTSDVFTIDNNPPEISPITVSKTESGVELKYQATDSLSLISDSSYSVNGSKWIKVPPTDGIFDGTSKAFDIKIPCTAPAYIEIKAGDIYGNYNTRGIFISR